MQSNPFDMSNMGLNQDNPLFTSMNMMRQMWEGMAANPMDLSAPTTAMPSVEDLDKKIKDLQAVENWLRLNLSMLTSTIQGLEIQRSTLSTFNSFAQSGMATMQSMSQPAAPEEKKPASVEDEENPTDGLMQAGQAWWGMMQQQFDAIAQATTQSMQQVQSASSTVAPDVPNPSADSTFGKKVSSASGATSKKTAAKKAAAKKSTAKKVAAKKTTPPTK